ncbi:MAG: hypothetical protein M3Y59_12860 [Myxococcota bacterium]|nr:hypothetical protein [Myxococcota bacterium]
MSSPRPLCEEIEEQEYRLLQLVADPDQPGLTTLQEVVFALERLRHRAADLQTANSLRADLIARRRNGFTPAPAPDPGAPLSP